MYTEKMASRLGAAAVLGAPLVGLGTGLVAGRAAGQKVKEERKRVKVWRAGDGAFVVVRSPKTKQAFDAKMEACLLATRADVDKVAEAYEAELEKIAVFNLLGRVVGGVGRAAAGGGRAALGAGQAVLGAGRGAATGSAGLVGRAAGGARRLAGDAAESFTAGMGGRSVGQARAAQRLQGMPGGVPATAAAASRAAPRSQRAFAAADQAAAARSAAATGTGAASGAAAGAGAAPGAAAGPGMLEQAKQWATNRYNLGGLQGKPASLGTASQWFGKLDPRQQAELAAMGLAGGAGAGFVGGTALS